MVQQYARYLRNFLSSFQLFDRNIILIQLEATQLTIAHAHQNGTRFTIKSHNIQPLNHSQITMRCIVNLTALAQAVSDYRAQHSLHAAPAIISIVDTQTVAANPLATLQIALCFSKGTQRIQSITPMRIFGQSITAGDTITIPASPDLLQLLLPPGSQPIPHLYASLALGLFLTCFWMYRLQAHLGDQLIKLTAQEKFLKESQHKLKTDVKASLQLSEQMQANQALFDRITALAKQHPSLLPVLTTASNIITTSAWLTRLECGQQPTPTQPQTKSTADALPLVLEGMTSNPDECSELIKLLSQHFQTSSFNLDHIKRPAKSATAQRQPYRFRITGQLQADDLHKLK